MWCAPTATVKTVGDVLRTPSAARRTTTASSRPLPPVTPSADQRTTARETSAVGSVVVPIRPQKPRLHSAPGTRGPFVSSDKTHRHVAVRCNSARIRGAGDSQLSLSGAAPRARRPIDEALFCALRMEGEDGVVSQLRALGPEKLTSDFRSLCSRLSMHNVTAAQFTFLCAAVLNSAVSQRECEVVFAFLRTEQSVGSLDVAELLSRLRTLFVSPRVLCALQLKRMLETNALSECTVSLDELQKAVDGVLSLLDAGEVRRGVTEQWRHLHAELCRIHVQYAVLVPTFRLAARRLAPALCSVVQALAWDGTVSGGDAASSSSSSVAATLTPGGTRCGSPAVVGLDGEESSTALLSTVTELYRQRLAMRGLSPSGAANGAGVYSGGFGAASRRAGRRSTWRSSDSAVDATNPHFVADLYATGPVICSRN